MAVSLLGLQGSGGASVWPQLQRTINATTSGLGESFGTVLLTGAPAGTFVAGESLMFSGGGTATLTQAALTSPNRLIIASPAGVISGTITGGTSGATAIVSSLEGAYTHPPANSNQFTNHAIEFSNRVFCLHGNTVYRLNESLGMAGGRCEEVFRTTRTRESYLADAALTAGMYVVYVSGRATLVAFYSQNAGAGAVRIKTTDGVSWSAALLASDDPCFTLASSGPGIVFNNNIYWAAGTTGNTVYDSATDTLSAGPVSDPVLNTRRSAIFPWNNRLFALNDTGSIVFLLELIAGTWVSVTALPSANANSRMFAVPGNDGAMYLCITSSSGYRSYRFGLGPLLEVTRGVLPFGVFAGTAATTDGWCAEVFTDKEFNDASVDNGPAETFVYLSTSDSSGVIRSCYRWADDIGHQHSDVRLVSASPLPANQTSGSGVGKTLTGNVAAPLVVDGVSVSIGDRILVTGELNGANNGIYEVTSLGSVPAPTPAAPDDVGTRWVLTRATDFDAVLASKVDTGAWVFVTGGSYLGHRFVFATGAPITLEVTPLSFTATPILVSQGAGCPQQIRLPHAIYSGGEYSFSPGGLDIRITEITPISGGERISYRIYKTPGAPNVTSLKVRFLYQVLDSNPEVIAPSKWGYIGSTSVGSIAAGNRGIAGLTADSEQGSSGGSIYTLDWMAVSQDGLPNYVSVGRKLVVYA